MKGDSEQNDNTQTHVVLTKGTMISHYKIIEKIGAGGMGEVYLAEDTELNRKVALKFLSHYLVSNEDAKSRFKREAHAAAVLEHPNIVTIYEVSEHQGRPYIVMHYVEGKSLRDIIKEKELPLDEIVDLAIQICEGLCKAHEAGVIHRDIKPSNICIGSDGRPKILDFGLAAVQGSEHLTKTGSTLGTIGYMSPEQIHGKQLDQRSDIFSLGVVLYEMIAGRPPFRRETEAATSNSILHDTPEPLARYKADVSDELQRIISKLLEKDREMRYQHADDLLADFRKLTRKFETRIAKEQKPSIAVLPFRDMSPQKDQEYFCDGMAEEIINALMHVEDLHVVARTSAFSFRGKEMDIREIGMKLGVETLLEGSVRKAGNRLRITAQLINVSDGYHLWSDRYDRVMEDMFAIQDEISLAIVDNLKAELLGGERAIFTKRHTESLEAYNLHLKGRYFWNKRTGESLKKAIDYFEQAIEKDPDYALTYAGLADAYRALPDYSSFSPKRAYLKAKNAAMKALEIDGTLAEAHASLAVSLNYNYSWSTAEREFKKAIEFKPSYATAHHWYALYLMYMARFDEAIEEMKRARELDPLSLAINRDLGTVLFYAGQYDQAIEALQKTIEMDPNFSLVHELLGRVYLRKAMYEKALAELEKEKSFRISWRPVLEALMGITYVKMGKSERARQVLNDLVEQSKHVYISPYWLAWVHFALEENDQGFECLEKAYQERDSWLCEIKAESFFDSVRLDPRFLSLLKKMGLNK